MKILIVVDMQNDFVSGPLGSAEAIAVSERIAEKIIGFDGMVVTTYDTHDENYGNTQEGRLLPGPHCIVGSDGWRLADVVLNAIRARQGEYKEFYKPTFGSTELANWLVSYNDQVEPIEEIEMVGVCTDICVVSNALLIKAFLPEVLLTVDASCCAGTTPDTHEAALLTMHSCQIDIANHA